MRPIHPKIAVILAMAILLPLSPIASANDAVLEGAWTLPAWAPNDTAIKGSFTGASETTQIRFRINDEAPQPADTAEWNAEKNQIDFTLPKHSYEAFGMLHVWAEDATGEVISEATPIGIADWHEFDITGQTAVEMLFPIESWDMQIRFTPCCLILGGYLRVQRVPVNPIGKTDGLPESLASEFLELAPDPTVVATAGLNADIGIDPDSPHAPEDITVYRWFKGKWTPVLGAELHAETNTIRFKALEGGFFVLAPKPKSL